MKILKQGNYKPIEHLFKSRQTSTVIEKGR